MEELIYDFIIDTWRIIRESINTHTEEEWKKLIDATDVLYNNPKYEELKGMSVEWLTGYIRWLEKRNNQ